MSEKVAKIERKGEEAKKQDYILRKNAMFAEVKLLSSQYRIDIMPIIKYTEEGIVPLLLFADVKDQYEALSEEAKEQINKNTNHNTPKDISLET